MLGVPHRARTLLVGAVIVTAPLLVASPAVAQYPPDGSSGGIRICGGRSARPGDEITVSSGGHTSGTPVVFSFDDQPVEAATATEGGYCGKDTGSDTAVATVGITVPDVDPGEHRICADSLDQHHCATLKVTGAKGGGSTKSATVQLSRAGGADAGAGEAGAAAAGEAEGQAATGVGAAAGAETARSDDGGGGGGGSLPLTGAPLAAVVALALVSIVAGAQIVTRTRRAG